MRRQIKLEKPNVPVVAEAVKSFESCRSPSEMLDAFRYQLLEMLDAFLFESRLPLSTRLPLSKFV